MINRITIVNFVLVMEAVMLLIATVWSQASSIDLTPHLVPHFKHILLGATVGIAISSSSLLLFWLGKFPSLKWFGTMRRMIENEIAPFFATVTTIDVVLLALASGFCEEVMFRGVFQDQYGLLGASVLFGIAHTPSLKAPLYGLWALAAGIALGLLYQLTGSLWTPIVAHVVNNVLGLLILRHLGQNFSAIES